MSVLRSRKKRRAATRCSDYNMTSFTTTRIGEAAQGAHSTSNALSLWQCLPTRATCDALETRTRRHRASTRVYARAFSCCELHAPLAFASPRLPWRSRTARLTSVLVQSIYYLQSTCICSYAVYTVSRVHRRGAAIHCAQRRTERSSRTHITHCARIDTRGNMLCV